MTNTCDVCRLNKSKRLVSAAQSMILAHSPRPSWWSEDQVAALKSILNEPDYNWSFAAKVKWLEDLERVASEAGLRPDRRAAVDAMLTQRAKLYVELREVDLSWFYDGFYEIQKDLESFKRKQG
jgi:hypothetical protein